MQATYFLFIYTISTMIQLAIQNLTKRYNKQKVGLDNYTLSLETGIIGLLGPNGAGKSTLMKMIATITKPTEGTITLNGVDIVKNPNEMRKVLGYLPQDFGVYPNLNAFEFLEYIAAIKGIGGESVKQRIEYLLENLNLIAAANRPIGTYSGGMKQRVGIAQALLNDPKVVIFDEPTVGLDPEERVRFRNLLTDLAGERIVILSSHIVSDIETIADTIVIMKNAKLLAHNNLTDIVQPIENQVYEMIVQDSALESVKKQFKVLSSMRQQKHWVVRLICPTNPTENMILQKANLEDAYLAYTH